MRKILNYKITIVARSPKDIKGVCNALSFIEKNNKSLLKKVQKINGVLIRSIHSYDNELILPEKIWVCGTGTVRESSVSYLASLLIHESVHCIKYEQGSLNKNFRDEPVAYRAQIMFLKKYGEKREYLYVTKLLKEKYWKKNFISISKNENIKSTNNLYNYYKKYTSFFH